MPTVSFFDLWKDQGVGYEFGSLENEDTLRAACSSMFYQKQLKFGEAPAVEKFLLPSGSWYLHNIRTLVYQKLQQQ